MKAGITSVLSAAVAAVAAFTGLADLERKDSKEFAYKYEMDAKPTTQDLDNSGAVDFTGDTSTSWLTLSKGAMIMDMTSGGQFLNSTEASGTAGDAWRVMNATSGSGGTGYTIESLLKIDSQVSGAKYALNLQASTWDSSLNAFLNITTNGIYWGSKHLTNLDATAWHTYRIVREGSSESNKFSVYVDGALVEDGLGNGFNYGGLNRVIIGSPGGDHKGKATVAYLRFTKGAYAPPAAKTGKAAKKWSGDFPVQYEMNAGDTRFVGNPAGGTDWTGSVDNNATITQDGVLLVTLPQAKSAWWRVNDSMWSANVGVDTAYTFEFKTKITGKWNLSSVGDRVIQFICGNPRDAAVFYIGENSVTWEPNGAATYTTIDSSDNTDAMHTFRLTYSGASQSGCPYVYTLWRDGVVIGTNLKGSPAYNQSASAGFPNLLRWGVTSTSSHGGSFDVDYLRWTTDGAWDYRDAPEGLIISFR